jgi:hypothetical protein
MQQLVNDSYDVIVRPASGHQGDNCKPSWRKHKKTSFFDVGRDMPASRIASGAIA